jgi:hypothetical protein
LNIKLPLSDATRGISTIFHQIMTLIRSPLRNKTSALRVSKCPLLGLIRPVGLGVHKQNDADKGKKAKTGASGLSPNLVEVRVNKTGRPGLANGPPNLALAIEPRPGRRQSGKKHLVAKRQPWWY